MQTAVSPGEFRRYAAPGVLGMIGISCYILADTFFVAKGTGSLGLAALNIAIPAYNLMNGLGLMVGVGGATHYSLCRAQGDAAEADRTFTHTLLLGLCIALVFVLTGTFGVVPLSRLLGANAETLDMTAVYLRLLLCFAPFFVTNNIMIAFVRNDGEPGRAMAGMIAGSLFNIVFDWVFIFPCGLGMFGAALATGASPLVSLLVLSGHLRRPSRGFHLRRERLRPRLLPRICAPGLSSLVSELASGITLLLINLVLLRIAGNTAVAAYGVIANLALVESAIFTGLSTGVQPLISRSAEADRRRLLHWTVTTSLVISALMYVLVFVFASPITAVFNSEHDPALAACAVPGLRIYFAGFLAACINIIAAAYFSAAGQASRGFIISLVRSIIAIPPVLFALSALLGVTGVWLTFPAVEALACVLSLLFILRSPK
ncbi:MATE family efflux transporter [Agathobaculum butyriciproducens]|uniref:MATE family efflux transporter n=1 Tax=Agathobaculum butyriciproducens TaxID=1628085 RepID=UPI00209761A4|nr:MATE family efflux transporter [Agathobaculum butyriciproducens]MEE0388793.1 MATE family efflux transporter [Agathobaculum sp.]